MELDTLPAAHRAFLQSALPRLTADERLVGVAGAGSLVTGSMDEYSDIDLVVVAHDAHYDDVVANRRGIAAGLGNLLAAFTGEHVGEPRLLICLYGPEPLHVDMKFVTADDLEQRVEDPAILWERNDALSAVMQRTAAEYPAPDLQWIEDRFWIWIHYAATKIGRGELFETLDFLAFLRLQVLGPLALQHAGGRPTGVRKLETVAPEDAARIRDTVAVHDPRSCAQAVLAAIDVYLDLRDRLAGPELITGRSAQLAATEYLHAVTGRIPDAATDA